MKRRVWNMFVTLSLVLMIAVLAFWAVSYARWIAIGPRDTSWTAKKMTSHGVWFEVKQGRFGFYVNHNQEDASILDRGHWSALPPQEQARLQQKYPDDRALEVAFAEMKRMTNSEVFHGWDYRNEPAVYAATSTPIYDSILGLNFGRMVGAMGGRGIYINVPAWMLVALLAIPGARRLRHYKSTVEPRQLPNPVT